MLKNLQTYFCANPKQLAANSNIIEPGYLKRTSVLDFVGAAFSRDRFNSRLPPARKAYVPEGKPLPQVSFLVTWAYRISA